MRLARFVSIILPLTLLSVFYVWQQTEVVSLAYEGQKRSVRFQELLDENSNLRYNLKKNTSLVCLGSKISRQTEFAMPTRYCLMKVARPGEPEGRAGKASTGAPSLVARLLQFGRQAEAKTISSLTFKAE